MHRQLFTDAAGQRTARLCAHCSAGGQALQPDHAERAAPLIRQVSLSRPRPAQASRLTNDVAYRFSRHFRRSQIRSPGPPGKTAYISPSPLPRRPPARCPPRTCPRYAPIRAGRRKRRSCLPLARRAIGGESRWGTMCGAACRSSGMEARRAGWTTRNIERGPVIEIRTSTLDGLVSGEYERGVTVRGEEFSRMCTVAFSESGQYLLQPIH